ncbi:MAG: CDP-diacylglycerol--glycerol-3-phosphate 3-phosphatidyltransferase [Candidatus Dadabacteria bacterium]|nr:MAG: CDP-diacylglycerol--glycerol-3-phosphate 3-phosphatidyltransferase [Candidatus Dadabacteria bacterium]
MQPITLASYASLPNILTLVRIGAIPILVWLLRDPAPRAGLVAFVVYFFASLTDFFDGYLARRYGLVTPLGKLLDPLADKLLVVSALIMIAVADRTPTVPGWLLVIVIGRELAITGLRSIAAAEGIIVAAEATGKFKMILQTIGVHALIIHYTYFGVSFYWVGMVLLLVSAVAGVWSAVEYHVAVFRELAARQRQG